MRVFGIAAALACAIATFNTSVRADDATAVAERFRKIVLASDLQALKAFMKPTYDKCATDSNRQVYDDYISRVFSIDAKPGLKSAKLRPITPKVEKRLYGRESTTYPVKASHILAMEFKDSPRKEGDTRKMLGEINIQYLVKRGGAWFLTFPCPTPEHFKEIARQNALDKKARTLLAKLDPATFKKIKAMIFSPSSGGMIKALQSATKALKDATGSDDETANMAARLIFFESQ